MKLLQIADESVDILKEKSPLILTATGIGLGVITMGLCGLASYRACDIIKEIKDDDTLDTKQKILEGAKSLIPIYIPMVVSGTGAIICIVKAYDINTKRLAAATALAEVSMETLRIYRDRARKAIGEEKEKEIIKEVREEQVNQNPPTDDNTTVVSGGTQLFRETITGQYFMSSKEKIAKACTELNIKLFTEMYVNIDEWCDELDIPHTLLGSEIGWRDGYPIRVSYSPTETPDGRSCLNVEYSIPPIQKYRHAY